MTPKPDIKFLVSSGKVNPTVEMIEKRKKWAEALRSGKYSQTKGTLKDGDGCLCGLGVYIESVLGHTALNTDFSYEVLQEDMHPRVLNYYWKINDREGKTFGEIADYVDEEIKILEGLLE